MKLIITLLLLLMTGAGSVAQSTATNDFSINDLKWENRILIITGIDELDSAFREQTALFRENDDQNRERDLILILLPNNGTALASSEPISQSSAGKILDEYVDNPSEFNLILIGKDGRVKFRTNQLISPNDIYQRIDRMPMRQREIDSQN